MFWERAVTIWVEALSEVFDSEHPFEPMQDISILVDYPLEEQHYPSLWVQLIPQGTVRNVGIGHIEFGQNEDHEMVRYYRWAFSGVIEITVAALSSLERARMMDELAKTIAFGVRDTSSPIRDLRQYVEHNDLVAMRVVWESFTIGGNAETPGTPWGTDDVIYESTLTLTIEGELRFDPDRGVLVPLSAISIETTTDPAEVDAPPEQGWV